MSSRVPCGLAVRDFQQGVVWCHEITPEFIQEIGDWHRAGRHVIGVRVFWNGKTGQEALQTLPTTSDDAEDCCSVFFVAQGVALERSKIWRIGAAAQAHQSIGAVDEQAGAVALLPSTWFIMDSQLPPLVPIFPVTIQHAVGEGIELLSGQPSMSIAKSRQGSRRVKEGQVAALSSPLPGLSASKRQRVLSLAQSKLDKIEQAIKQDQQQQQQQQVAESSSEEEQQ